MQNFNIDNRHIEGHITKVKKITSDDTLMSVKRVLHRELKRSITTRC